MPMKPARSPTILATAPTIGPRIAPRTAIPKTVPRSWPRSARGVETVTQERAPAQVRALERPWRKRATPTVRGRVGERQAEGRDGEQQEPADDGVLRPDPACDDAAGNPAEHGAGAEGSDEEARLELGEVERIDVGGNERDQRAEQHRVEEDDRADRRRRGGACGTAYVRGSVEPGGRGTSSRTTENAPSRLPLRPASRLTFAEASADRGTINLRCSVLGALGNLGRRFARRQVCRRAKFTQFACVAHFGRYFRQRSRIAALARGTPITVTFPRTTKNAPGRWLPRPAS